MRVRHASVMRLGDRPNCAHACAHSNTTRTQRPILATSPRIDLVAIHESTELRVSDTRKWLDDGRDTLWETESESEEVYNVAGGNDTGDASAAAQLVKDAPLPC